LGQHRAESWTGTDKYQARATYLPRRVGTGGFSTGLSLDMGSRRVAGGVGGLGDMATMHKKEQEETCWVRLLLADTLCLVVVALRVGVDQG
jgi:hypothetical protein